MIDDSNMQLNTYKISFIFKWIREGKWTGKGNNTGDILQKICLKISKICKWYTEHLLYTVILYSNQLQVDQTVHWLVILSRTPFLIPVIELIVSGKKHRQYQLLQWFWKNATPTNHQSCWSGAPFPGILEEGVLSLSQEVIFPHWSTLLLIKNKRKMIDRIWCPLIC